MIHAFLTFFSQPTGDMLSQLGQLIGAAFFVLFAIAALFALFKFSKEHPSELTTIVIFVVIFAVMASSEGARNGAILTGAVGVYAASAFVTAIAAAMATPIFWLIVIAMLIANKN